MTFKKLTYTEAVATLVGTIIGAGVLGMPYAVNKTGFLPGLFLIIFIGLAVMLENLFLGEAVLRTKETHQLSGYAEIYLGKWAKKLMGFAFIFGIYGALLAYFIGEGEALNAIFGGGEFLWSMIFWGIGVILLYIGLNIIKVFELIMLGIMVLVILLISLFGISFLNIENLTYIDLSKIFSPYGVVLFAFLGASAIREVREILKRQEKNLKSVIIISSLIPMIIYILFTFIVIGVTGLNTTEVATVGLGKIIGTKMILFGNIFAIFAMGTSFLTLGLSLKNTLFLDFKLNKNLAWALAAFVPLILYMLGIKDFIKTIAFVGAIVGGIEGILIILIYYKAKTQGIRKPEYSMAKSKIFGGILILMFVLGMIYTLVTF